MDPKVIEENHDARYLKAQCTGEEMIPLGDFALSVKEMTGGTSRPPINHHPDDKLDVSEPINAGSGSSSSPATGPAPEPPASEETRARGGNARRRSNRSGI